MDTAVLAIQKSAMRWKTFLTMASVPTLEEESFQGYTHDIRFGIGSLETVKL